MAAMLPTSAVPRLLLTLPIISRLGRELPDGFQVKIQGSGHSLGRLTAAPDPARHLKPPGLPDISFSVLYVFGFSLSDECPGSLTLVKGLDCIP